MKIKVNQNEFERLTKDLGVVPRAVTQKSYDYFKSITPIDSGNARNKTKLRGDTILADYAYAGRLDDGYSDQARRGMSEPTTEYMLRELDRVLRRI